MNSDSQKTQKLNSFGEKETSGAPDTQELMQSLKATNAHFAYVLEGAGLGSWDWWLEDNRVHFDRRWCEIVGLRHEEIQQHLSTWDSLVHPDDKAQCYADIKAYLDGKTPYYENIHRMKHANGSWVWILDRGRVSERDATGKAIRFTGTHLDITSYKESERLSINIQKMAQIGGWELQEENLKMTWTDQTYRIFESPAGGEVTFKTFLQFFSNEAQNSFESLVERGFEGRSFQQTSLATFPNGLQKWLEIMGEPVLGANGRVFKLRGTCQDITEKRITELKMREKESQFEEAQKVAKIGSWSFDVRSGKISWSKQMFELFPESIAQGAPNFEKHRSTIHPDDANHWEQTVKKCLQDGKPYSIKFRSVFPDKVIWMEALGQATRGADGSIITLSGTCQDISEKVQAELDLEEQRLKTIHAAKLSSLGEMSAGIAHEINNPLAIINGLVHALPGIRSDEEKFQKKIETIKKAVVRITRIVNGLRKFSRSSDGVVISRNSLSDIVKEALIIAEPRAKRSSIKLTSKIEAQAEIMCDALEIEQVIINLLNNAIDASRDREEKWVHIEVLTSAEDILLRVTDSGPGITKEVEAKLFQPFFTTKPVGEGTGLGLSISKGILDHHNASISLNKTSAHTCFEVRFQRVRGVESVV